tara:strand:+ start:140 stop:418 length:279 start_codon:yes stop_codon:yes gene_type:complete
MHNTGLTKEKVNSIVLSVTREVINKKEEVTINSMFIGIDSIIESIDIAQIIAGIEEKIEKEGIKNFDLFEKVFEQEKLSFDELSDLIVQEIN